MPPGAPHVALRMALQHVHGPPAHLVDVVDLPRGVVEEVDRRLLGQEVVVVGRAAHEGGHADVVADLEPQTLGEEPLGGVLVDRPDHDVAELAGADGLGPQDSLRPGVAPFHPPPPVGGGRLRRRREQPARHSQGDPEAVHRLVDDQGGERLLGDRHVEPAQLGADAVQVVEVVHSHPQRHQPPLGAFDQNELLTAIGGGEATGRRLRQPERLVVGGRLGHVRHADGHRLQTMQAHAALPGSKTWRISPTPWT